MRTRSHGVNNIYLHTKHLLILIQCTIIKPDREKIKEAMQKECEAHYKEGNYKLIKRDELPEGAT